MKLRQHIKKSLSIMQAHMAGLDWCLIVSSFTNWSPELPCNNQSHGSLFCLQAHDAAKVALLKAKQAHQAAHASMQQPCLLQQPYWCEGAGTDLAALAAWHQAGLPLRAVVYLRAPAEGAEPAAVPPLIAGAAVHKSVCMQKLHLA